MDTQTWKSWWLPGVVCCVSLAQAADVEQLTQICHDCHGEDGLSQHSDVPVLAGQPYTVIEDNLLAFRSGERPCTTTGYRHGDTSRPPTSMCEIAGGLADEEIAALAAHFESLAFVPREQDYDPSRVEAGAAVHEKGGCAACHGERGRQTLAIACRLAGQWKPYLADAFRQIRAGERFAPQVMKDAIMAFSEEDIENLLHYYASQQDW